MDGRSGVYSTCTPPISSTGQPVSAASLSARVSLAQGSAHSSLERASWRRQQWQLHCGEGGAAKRCGDEGGLRERPTLRRLHRCEARPGRGGAGRTLHYSKRASRVGELGAAILCPRTNSTRHSGGFVSAASRTLEGGKGRGAKPAYGDSQAVNLVLCAPPLTWYAPQPQSAHSTPAFCLGVRHTPILCLGRGGGCLWACGRLDQCKAVRSAVCLLCSALLCFALLCLSLSCARRPGRGG